MRDTVARFWQVYYGEVRNILDTVSWGTAQIPTHLTPQPRTIRVHHARDGFIVNHFNLDSGTGWYEFVEIHPIAERTIRELTGGGFDYQENAPVFFSVANGRRLIDPEYDEALDPKFRQRYDIITNEQVPQLTGEEARRNAEVDLELYLEIL